MADDTQTPESATFRADDLQKQAQAAEQDPANFSLVDLIKSFFNWLNDLFSSADDKNAPDYEDASDQDRAQIAQKDASRVAADEKEYSDKYGDFKKTAAGKWNISTVVSGSKQLLDMRAREEAANGGKPVEAGMPFEGEARVSSAYGHRESPGAGGSTEHQGIDIAPMPKGTRLGLVSTMPGIVIGAGWLNGYGNCVEIMDIYGVHHRYGHMSELSVKVGDSVEKGEAIGKMGMTGHATGVHLHYEQRDDENHTRDPQLQGRTWRDGEVMLGAHAPVPVAPALVQTVTASQVSKTQVAAVVSTVKHPTAGHVPDLSLHGIQQAALQEVHSVTHGAKQLWQQACLMLA